MSAQQSATAEHPAATARPATTPFERLGGHATLQRITDRFYDLMDGDPAYADLRAMHAADLAPMRASLASFLAGWSGGPRDWFDANPGRCMMSLHREFPIDDATARQWSNAMTRAIDDVVGPSDPEIAGVMAGVLQQMAMGMAR